MRSTTLCAANQSEWGTYSRVYDTFYGDYREDADYLLKRWQPNWQSVLEVGAGTGRLTDFFSRQGVSRYVGLDTCREMLQIALAKEWPDGVALMAEDFLACGTNEQFDLFVYAFNTANYILEPAALQEHLRLCSSHLRDGGSVFLDMYVPFAISKGETGTEYKLRERVERAGRVFELHDWRAFDPVTLLEERHQTSREMLDGRPQAEIHFRTWRRYYPPEEIEKIAQSACLKVSHVEKYGPGYVDGYYVLLS